MKREVLLGLLFIQDKFPQQYEDFLLLMHCTGIRKFTGMDFLTIRVHFLDALESDKRPNTLIYALAIYEKKQLSFQLCYLSFTMGWLKFNVHLRMYSFFSMQFFR